MPWTRIDARGNVYLDLNELERASFHLERARVLVDTLDDARRRGRTYQTLARLRRFEILYPEALELYAIALDAFNEAGDRLGVVDVIGNRGVLLEIMGQHEAALDAQTESLEYYRETDDESGIATAMYNISEAYRELGEYEQYLAYAEDTLAIDLKVGDQSDIAYSLTNVGRALLLLERIEEARPKVEEAISIFDDLGALRDRAWSQLALAEIEFTGGDLERARTLLEDAAAAIEARGARSLLIGVLELLARVDASEGDFESALRNGRRGLAIATDIGEPDQADTLLSVIIAAMEARGDADGVIAALRQQRALRERIANESRAQAMAWTQTQAEFMRRAERIDLLEAERALQDARLEQESNLRIGVILVATALLVIFVLVYGRIGERRLTQRLKEQVEMRTRELSAALSARSDFLANVSHEIRTPMNAVMGFTRLALQSDAGPEQRGFLEKSERASRALLQLLNDVLDFSKLEAGMMQRADARTRLASLVQDVMDMGGARAIGTDVVLDVELDPTLPEAVTVDGIRLKQVLVKFRMHSSSPTPAASRCAVWSSRRTRRSRACASRSKTPVPASCPRIRRACSPPSSRSIRP